VTLTLDAAADTLGALAKRYGPYPNTELDLVVTPTYALGIEYPGLIVLNQQLFTPEQDLRVGPEETWLESTVAHEVAHQWFYNLVGNDQLDHPWLDESLAQFATWEYFRDVRGAAAAQVFEDSLEGRWSRVEFEAIPLGLPVRDYEPAAYSAIIYGRGPLFLEALRSRMGGESFDRFMRDYIERNQWKIATTEGFRALAERDCDCDLGHLFEKWVYP
jgi:aminopeptidase N